MSGQVERARAAWGDALPEWVLVLAQECEATSQNKAAAKIGRSAAVVSTLLGAKYPGDLAAIEELVRGALMREVVQCPVLGDLPKNECAHWRKRAKDFAGTNALNVRMYRSCNRCDLNKPKGDAAHAVDL